MTKHRYGRALPAVLAAALVALVPAAALAHKGHAGPMVTFLEAKAALKAMLPDGARVTQRKEQLAAEGAAWAKASLGTPVQPGVYVYYLARDQESGKVLGAAMVREADYEHAEVMLAVGVDTAGVVTRAAVLGTNQQYVPEFQDGVGTGFLEALDGATVQDLAAREAEAPADAEALRFTVGQLKDMAALLATLLHGVQA